MLGVDEIMSHDDNMLKLFITSQEKCQDACNAFEEHFTWLAESIAAARQTFMLDCPFLMPGIPSIRKKVKKTLPVKVIVEDSPVQVASKNGDHEEEEQQQEEEKQQQQQQENDTTTPPRRRPTRMAKNKTMNYIDYKLNRKMRRPSTSEQATATAVKIRGGTRKALKKRSLEKVNKASPEPRVSADKRSRSSSRNNLMEKQNEAHTDPQVVILQPSSSDKTTVSPQHATPKKASLGSRRLSVNLNLKRLSSDNTSQDSTTQVSHASTRVSGNISPVVAAKTDDSRNTSQVTDAEMESSCNTTQITIAKARDEESSQRNQSSDGDSLHLSLRLEDSEDCKSDGENEAQRPQDGVESSKEVNRDSPVASPRKLVQSETLVAVLSSEVQNLDEDEVVLNSPPKPVPRARTTRTKQKAPQPVQPLIDITDSEKEKEEEEPAMQSIAKPRSTRTKQKVIATQDTTDSQMLPPTDVPKARVTHTKVKAKIMSVSSEPEMGSDLREKSDKTCKSKSMSPIEVPKARSTRTKKKAMEVELVEISGGTQVETLPQKQRSTRTKKRPVEEPGEKQSTLSSDMKRRKTDEGSEPDKSGEHNQAQSLECGHKLGLSPKTREERRSNSRDSSSSSGVSLAKSAASTASEDIKKTPTPPQEPVRRMTRSKMRQPKTSPVKASPQPQSPRTPNQGNFHRMCCTPKDSDSPKSPVLYQLGRAGRSPVKYSPRPYSKSCVGGKGGPPRQHTALGMLGEELTTEVVEVAHSQTRVTRHSLGKGTKPWGVQRDSSTRRYARRSLARALVVSRAVDKRRCKQKAKGEGKQRGGMSKARSSPQTMEKKGPGQPRLLNSSISSTYGSSGRLTPKTLSRLPLGLTSSSSSEYKTYRIFGMSSEMRRPANILTGASSFIKVQSAKPTREDMEEKRQQELQRKRAKAEEMGRKKEELLKAKRYEKKRANEERMRRVQEAREERERKAQEAKEQQERERMHREERQMEEQQRRKQQMLAKKKAEEEAKAFRIKEQQEEERKRKEEEKRKQMEEEKRKQMEEERRVEEARRQEEERRAQLIEQRRVQEEERKRKVAEMERIAREKQELERLKQQEAQRKAESPAKKPALNDTYTSSGDNKENDTTAHNSTYTTTAHNSTYTAEKPPAERSDSYELTPYKKTKRDKSNGNNYNINSIKSDDSTDNETSPKKKIPTWAMNSQLNNAMIQQEYYPPILEKIFIPEELLCAPNLSEMFPVQRRRFHKRTSSAIWNTPPSKMFQTS